MSRRTRRLLFPEPSGPIVVPDDPNPFALQPHHLPKPPDRDDSALSPDNARRRRRWR